MTTVLHVGTSTERRVHALADLRGALARAKLAPEPVLLDINCNFDPAQVTAFCQTAAVIVVLNAYPGRMSCYTLHRLGFLLRVAPITTRIVVETCPLAQFTRDLLQPWIDGGRITLSVTPTQAVLQLLTAAAAGVQAPRMDPRAHFEAFAHTLNKVRSWKGDTDPFPAIRAMLPPKRAVISGAQLPTQPEPAPARATLSSAAGVPGVPGVPDVPDVPVTTGSTGPAGGAAPGVCLVMIVRDESRVIQRALRSAWPFISAYCILDTGSTDDTREKVAEVVREDHRPGMFMCGEWLGFGPSRSQALAMARAMAKGPDATFQWLFMMDADDVLVGRPGASLTASLQADSIGAALVVRFGGHTTTIRNQVFSVRHPWMYKGVLHEYPCLPPPTNVEEAVARKDSGILPEADFFLDARTEGFRSRIPEKYLQDALVLEKEVALHPEDSRSLFYLAQSWRDAGRPGKARLVYRRVVDNAESWAEERYVACQNLVENDGEPRGADDAPVLPLTLQEKVAVGWRALEFSPSRREIILTLLTISRTTQAWSREVYSMGLLGEVHGSKSCMSSFLFGRLPAYGPVYNLELARHAEHFGYRGLAAKLVAASQGGTA
jgi:hypothetical protein